MLQPGHLVVVVVAARVRVCVGLWWCVLLLPGPSALARTVLQAVLLAATGTAADSLRGGGNQWPLRRISQHRAEGDRRPTHTGSPCPASPNSLGPALPCCAACTRPHLATRGSARHDSPQALILPTASQPGGDPTRAPPCPLLPTQPPFCIHPSTHITSIHCYSAFSLSTPILGPPGPPVVCSSFALPSPATTTLWRGTVA